MKLIKFNEKDFDDLVRNIDSPLEMMVWAGPKYKYPLTLEQISERISQTINGKTKNHLFSLFNNELNRMIGFIEIEILGEDKGSIQSVMIYKAFRSFHYSEKLLNLAITYAFNDLKMNKLELKVFSFNYAAVSCYKKVGFVQAEVVDIADPKSEKMFQLIVMTKEKEKKPL